MSREDLTDDIINPSLEISIRVIHHDFVAVQFPEVGDDIYVLSKCDCGDGVFVHETFH